MQQTQEKRVNVTDDKIFITAEQAIEQKLLKGQYKKAVEQNKNLQSAVRKYRRLRDKLVQENEEMSAGILMLAEITGIEVPKGTDNRDLVSEIAVAIENLQAVKSEMVANK